MLQAGTLPGPSVADTYAARLLPTPPTYSTYEEECRGQPSERRKIMILGGGPVHIDEGIGSTTAAACAALAMLRGYGHHDPATAPNPTDCDALPTALYWAGDWRAGSSRRAASGVIVQLRRRPAASSAAPSKRQATRSSNLFGHIDHVPKTMTLSASVKHWACANRQAHRAQRTVARRAIGYH